MGPGPPCTAALPHAWSCPQFCGAFAGLSDLRMVPIHATHAQPLEFRLGELLHHPLVITPSGQCIQVYHFVMLPSEEQKYMDTHPNRSETRGQECGLLLLLLIISS